MGVGRATVHNSWRRSAAIFLTVASIIAFLDTAQADNFRFGDIRWQFCSAGFYDPRFPTVCADRTSNLRVGFTITAAWSIAQNSEQSMLQFAAEDLAAYRAGNCAGPDKSCALRLSRLQSTPSNERKIGYRTGIATKRATAGVSPFHNDQSIPVPGTAGIVNCPVAGECGTAQTANYVFRIDRLSKDSTMVYARYSFEILFPNSGDYTVFFEGCCRPTANQADPDIYVSNNANLVFHLRTGVRVSSVPTAMSLPTHSYRFAMPDIVHLRVNGVKGPKDNISPACAVPVCGTSCALQFNLQGYHPIDEFRNRVTFRIGDEYEQGQFKCTERNDPQNPASPLLWVSTRCPSSIDNLQTQIDKGQPAFRAPSGLTVSPQGLVTFSVKTASVFHTTIMADIVFTEDNKVISVPLDVLVRVSEAANNPNPPTPTYFDTILNPKGIFPFPSTRTQPINIQCGRTTFSLPQTTTTLVTYPAYQADYLRVGFKDHDDGSDPGCAWQPQSIAWIDQAYDLPKGVSIGNATATGTTPNGRAFLELKWRPQCEDRSQIGLFMFCFIARDNYPFPNQAGFPPLISTPSPYGFDPSSAIKENPSCMYVRSLGPGDNAAPVYVEPTAYAQCSKDCCDCCGRPPCACEATGQCCFNLYGNAGNKFEFQIRAQHPDPFVNITFTSTFPGQTTQQLAAKLIENSLQPPYLAPPKYGCGTKTYSQCVSNPANSSDSTSVLVWDLTPQSPFLCFQGTNPVTPAKPCGGVLDTTTCGPPGTFSCQESQAQLIVQPFKICYQARQVIPSYVDVGLWQTTYGTLPGNNSCEVCFMLNVANRPFFVDQYVQDGETRGTPLQSSLFEAAVDKELVIRLEAADNNADQFVNISLLSDPGAPNGGELTVLEQTVYQGVLHKVSYTRFFKFTPKMGQENTLFTVCFQVTNQNFLSSEKWCPRISVSLTSVSWAQVMTYNPANAGCELTPCPWYTTGPQDICLQASSSNRNCPKDGYQVVTVGCTYSLSVKGTSRGFNNLPLSLYDINLRVQHTPTCSTCSHALEVRMCDGHSNMTCCGNGMCDGAETGSNCPQDCPPDEMMLSPNPYFPGDASAAIFSFTPTRTQQGRRILTCIEAYDLTTGTKVIDQNRQPDSAPSLCIVYDVESCRYCVPPGATLRSIARHYLLNVDWLRLYNVNPSIPNPNDLISSTMINIGPRYTVRPGDTLLSIAAVTKTTVKAILENNPAVTTAELITVGDKLCLLLCSAAN